MRLEGRTPQVTQFQPSNTVSDVAQTAKPQNTGAAQAALNGAQLAKDQFGAAKNAAPEYTNQAKSSLQVPDTLRRTGRPVDSEVAPERGEAKLYPCTTDIEPPTKLALGEKVRVGEKVYPTAVGAGGKTPLCETEPVIGEKLGPKPGFDGFDEKPVTLTKLDPKPGAKPTDREPGVYYGKSTSSDTEIKVPEPERKPEPSPWGKPIPEPKYPDMWKD